MKMNKEFSDALGFRSLTSFNSFIAEYPVEGATIQKICDEAFTENCIRCYPIIADLGIDPTTYVSKTQIRLHSWLSKQFPIKTLIPDVAEISKPITPPPSKPAEHRPAEPKPAEPKPAEPQPNTLQPNTLQPIKCSSCVMLRENEAQNNKAYLDISSQYNKELSKNKLLRRDLNNAHAEIAALRLELAQYKNDPEFLSIMQYQKMKRQRKQ